MMANRFYKPGEQRSAKVNDLFSSIAPRYDLMNDLQSFGLHRFWKRRLIGLANARPGEQALDVCCGTGDLAFGLAGNGARVWGLDFSEPMLRVAAARQKRLNERDADAGSSREPRPENPKFTRGDALELPFQNNFFDIVTVGYGLRNLASWEQGLAEMLRVLKPGGRLLALDFGKPDAAAWRRIYFAYLRLFVPLLGALVCRDSQAYGYILESLKHYPAQRGVEAAMLRLGMKRVGIVNMLGGVMSINYGEKAG